MTVPQRIVRQVPMMLTYARAFTVASASIEHNRGILHGFTVSGRDDLINANHDFNPSIKRSLSELRTLCSSIPSLAVICFEVDRLELKVDNGIAPALLANSLEHLQHSLMDQLREHFYFPVTRALAIIYDDCSAFGPDVYIRFPSARIDIHNAGRCLAFGMNTAAVFHLMRVMEVALKVLSRSIGTDYAADWGNHIKAINKVLDKPYKLKTVIEKRKEPALRRLLGDLVTVKNVWRNPTMHIVNEYDAARANGIYQAVAAFMENMAASYRETGKPISSILAFAGAEQQPTAPAQ